MEDAALSAFSVFFTQSPSFLDYQVRMQQGARAQQRRVAVRGASHPLYPTDLQPARSQAKQTCRAITEAQSVIISYPHVRARKSVPDQ
jgi:hypothetical protein